MGNSPFFTKKDVSHLKGKDWIHVGGEWHAQRKKKITDVDVLIQMTEAEIEQLSVQIRQNKKKLAELKDQKEREEQKKLADLVASSGLSKEELECVLMAAAEKKKEDGSVE